VGVKLAPWVTDRIVARRDSDNWRGVWCIYIKRESGMGPFFGKKEEGCQRTLAREGGERFLKK
jgi:hypothetical protein